MNLRSDCFIEINGKSHRAYGFIDKFKRQQSCLILEDLYPTRKGVCCCGCNTPLIGKQRRWASKECTNKAYITYAIVAGSSDIIRKELFKRDKGFCQNCGVLSDDWQADHIIPVYKGGGGCNLDNYQTLCLDCHKTKTKQDRMS